MPWHIFKSSQDETRQTGRARNISADMTGAIIKRSVCNPRYFTITVFVGNFAMTDIKPVLDLSNQTNNKFKRSLRCIR